MDNPDSSGEKNNESEFESDERRDTKRAYRARMAVQQQRDNKIVALINEAGLLTVDLVLARLGMPPTASNIRIVQTRCLRLSQNKRITQIKEGSTTYYCKREPASKKHKQQNFHRHMESRFWTLLKLAYPVDLSTRRTGEQLWAQFFGMGKLVPDGYFQIGTKGLFLECDTGSDDLGAIETKAKRYLTEQKDLLSFFGIQSFQVLWVTKVSRRAYNIAQRIQGIGSGWHFLVTAEQSLDVHNPSSILKPIWLSPQDFKLHTFLEE